MMRTLRFPGFFASLLSLFLFTVPFAGCGDSSSAPGATDDGGGGDDARIPRCGDGIKDPQEQCDDGNGVKGDGCEADCTFSCNPGDGKCDDGDPCNGMESCLPEHVCKAGTALADGASCGGAKICRKGICGDAQCGDGIVSAPEECDDANQTNGDGCDNCKFSCLSTDANRNCTPLDPCAGNGVCNDMSHLCTAGRPLLDGASCGGGKVCMKGVCVMSLCGNGKLDQGEQCDDGNQVSGDGCEPNCTFSCTNPVNDCKMAAPACNVWSCNGQHVCAPAADGAQDGKTCGMNLICKMGACVGINAVCGNGTKEPGEDCDFGMANGPGAGCEKTCKFSCTTMPNSCPDMNICNGVEMCAAVMVNGQAGQKCMPGANAADGTACGMGNICLAAQCKATTCGDGFVDKGAGEQCEPPNTAKCDAMCKLKPFCGDGIREMGEQCDDGNAVNMDGCTACKFDQDQRVNYLKMQFATDATCTKNALGAAIVSGLAQGQLQTSLDGGIKNGSITILFAMLGLMDLSGTNAANINVGVVNGTPVMGMNYDGTIDLDWWYTASVMGLDMSRVPLAKLPASITNKVLSAGPGNIVLNLLLNGMAAPLKMSNVTTTATVNAVSTPLVSMNMTTPGHLPVEQLDPTLQSYASTGQPNANGAGKLCGNVAASSLSKVLLPSAVTNICGGYTTMNSMLDLIVGGCGTFFGPIVKATQPDQEDPTVAPVGAGPPYKLSLGANNFVTTCKDKNGATVNLASCLDDAAYSSFFKFTTDRVIIK